MALDRRPIPTAAALADVGERFAERHAQGKAPSTVYGVIAGGRVVESRGFGDTDGHGTPPTADTAYRLASITKSFTAATLLHLRDAGVLSLDAPITDFVPALAGLRLPRPDAPVPTLRMLATMSSGLPNDDPWADRQEALTDDEFDAVLRGGVRFAWLPGTEFEYSNLGYALLGRAIQAASGRRYHDLVAEALLAPLGLTSTGFTSDVAAPGGVAVGFEQIEGEWRPMPFSGPGAFSPIGGLFSTVTDLGRWVQYFLDAHCGETAGPLSAASRREMQQGHRVIPPRTQHAMASEDSAGYGFGLVVAHDPDRGTVVSHSGGYPGFSSHMRWHPASGVGIVAFENATYAGVSRPATAAMHALLDSLDVPPAWEPWPETLIAQRTVDDLLRRWDDEVAAGLFSDNVGLDEPFERRRAKLDEALARVGALGPIDDERGNGPDDRTWRIHGELADLRCEITMNPLDPPRVQTLEIQVEERPGPRDAT
jgi:CubicO group peptidase (beta-lactamase class C family)